MFKPLMIAGLCALTFSAAPASAQDAAAGQCRPATAGQVGRIPVFDGFAQPKQPAAKDNVRTARELGSRAAVGRRFQGGVRVATGDVNGDASGAARMQCSNNLKQMGTAAH